MQHARSENRKAESETAKDREAIRQYSLFRSKFLASRRPAFTPLQPDAPCLQVGEKGRISLARKMPRPLGWVVTGFTLLELLIAIAVITALALVIASGVGSFRESAALDQAVDDTIELLRQARARTLASENALGYGVHFASTSVTLFPGGTFVPGNTANSVVNLPAQVEISSIALSTTTGNVFFERLSGSTRATGTVDFVTSRTSKTKRIQILLSGVLTKI